MIRYLLTQKVPTLVKEPPQERRGVDYATLSFFSAAANHQAELVEEMLQLFDDLWPTGQWEQAGRSAHYERVFVHVTGARIELTAPSQGEGKNAGGLSLSLPGGCFFLQETNQAAFMLWRLSHMDGFRHFTRLDLMSTELRPEWPAERVVRSVEAGETWVKGYSTYRLWADREADGAIDGGATIYWGSPRADRLCRTYDKAADGNWGIPAIRDEVQLRRGWAKSTGQELVKLLDSHLTVQAMDDAVKDLAAGVINRHLQYMTLQGADPKTDKNWTRKAEPADWFASRIGRSVASIRKAPRPAVDLESTVDWGVRQYGRYFALSCLRYSLESQLPLEAAVEGLWERFLARLSDEDLEEITAGMDADEAARWRQEHARLCDGMAWEAEHADLR